METTSIALRRSVASVALLSLCLQIGSAVAADFPACASGGGTGIIEVSVAALTSDGRLLCFKRRGASRAREIGFVSGLMNADSRLIGIDYRVQDGLLYGVGNGGGVYRIDTDTAAAATFVNSSDRAVRAAPPLASISIPRPIGCGSSATMGQNLAAQRQCRWHDAGGHRR